MALFVKIISVAMILEITSLLTKYNNINIFEATGQTKQISEYVLKIYYKNHFHK